MIKIPYEHIIGKIQQESDISEEVLNEKINAKMKQLSGLISREGAAHIVANELGIKLFDNVTGKLQIKNIVPGLRNVETVGKVLQAYELREFNTNNRQGKVASFLMADETGKIRVVMWGSQADNIHNLKEGTIVKIIGSYVKENSNYIELHLNEKSKLIIDPPGETVEVKDMVVKSERKAINELKENDNAAEILATIVQVFEPRFFEICPKCGKRAKPEEGIFVCAEHKNVEPDYSYVLNLVVDDGTDNIRAVFFRDSMEKLLNAKKEKILEYRQNPESFEQVKNDLLGNMVKINGRAKKNLFFDRIELVANSVDINPNPEEEIRRLDEEIKNAEK
ncbi:hypothetical protein HYU09_03205 [Candidatus Woesearchaeota archaeon]|nr:hypothetical protein [Candidatus Woesearchaeota archaeon]